MPRKTKIKPFQWRNSHQLRGVRSILKRDTNACTDGAYVTIDLKTARNLLEVCDQAIHTEIGHEPTEAEMAELNRDIELYFPKGKLQ